MKPKIGTNVYCIYEDSIAKYKVGYIGKNSFIIDELHEDLIFNVLEWQFEDYDKQWFTSLAKAKTEICKRYPNAKLFKRNDDYWAVK